VRETGGGCRVHGSLPGAVRGRLRAAVVVVVVVVVVVGAAVVVVIVVVVVILLVMIVALLLSVIPSGGDRRVQPPSFSWKSATAVNTSFFPTFFFSR
jgi:hypothetical protein